MKVCLLNDTFPPIIDGVTNAVVNYADILGRRDDTEVLVGTPYYPNANYESYNFPVISYPSLDTSNIANGLRAGYPFAIKEISEMISYSPDIIHTHCPIASCFVARSIRHATDAPIILTYHTKFDIDIRNIISIPQLQNQSIQALVNNVSACDEVWAVSKGAGESLQSLGFKGGFKVMPNGVDFPKGRVDENIVYEATKEYDLPNNIPIFLFVGRIMNYKNLPLIIEALYKLAQKKDFRMVIIGQGADYPSLKQLIESYGIPYDETSEDGIIISHPGNTKGKIIFTGPIKDRNILRAWNTKADLFVFPSTFDTNGLVVREAAACSLASLLIKDSCAAEGIKDGHNGYLCEENAESIYSLLDFATEHLDEIHQTGINAMNEIYLSWEEAINMAREAYEEVLEKKHNNLLPPKKDLIDDPIYNATANISSLYNEIHKYNHEYFEGMLDNFINNRIQESHKLMESINEKKDALQDYLLSIIKGDTNS